MKRHEAADVAEYVNDGAFRSLVNEMLDTKGLGEREDATVDA